MMFLLTAGPNPTGPGSLLFNGMSPPVDQTFMGHNGLSQPPKYGIAIQIVAVDSIADNVSEGTFVDIYDATGNIVAKYIAPYKAHRRPEYDVLLLGCKNSDGRTVGAGTYLGVIHVRKIMAGNSVNRIYRTKIGVVR